jgi:hypothetical protein
VAGRWLVGLLRTTDCGHWYLTVDGAGTLSGALLFDPALVRDVAATDRLAATVVSVRELGHPGVLPVADLVVEDGAVWLVTVAAPGPTVGEFLEDGPARHLNAGSAATLLNETAQTLAALHAEGVVHGALGPSSVLIGPDGKAALSEVGLAVALGVRRAEATHDARGWARLAAQLARGWAGDDIQGAALLGQAAATADVEGLEEARFRLIDGRAVLPAGFLERGALVAAAHAWSAHMASFAGAPSQAAAREGPAAGGVPGGVTSARSLLAAPARPAGPLQSGAAALVLPAGSGPGSIARADLVRTQEQSAVTAGLERSHPGAARYQPAYGSRPPGGVRGAEPGPPADARRGFNPASAFAVRGAPPIDDRRRELPEPVEPIPPKKRRTRLLVLALSALAVLLAATGAAYVLTRPPDTLIVNGVEVEPPAKAGCNSTVSVLGVINTNGGAGTVRYRWIRNAGDASAVLPLHIKARHERTEVTLRWTFEGKGTFDAEATLQVLDPTAKSATGKFAYECK